MSTTRATQHQVTLTSQMSDTPMMSDSLLGSAVMNTTFSIKDGSDGLWCIFRNHDAIYERLPFARAIKLARSIAHSESVRMSSTVIVEMVPTGLPSFKVARFAPCDGALSAAVHVLPESVNGSYRGRVATVLAHPTMARSVAAKARDIVW
jgi:hypothetical protein